MSAPLSVRALPPCVLHEDEHLLVVNKPPGWNTHSPAPFAGEGIYDWLRHREPRWAGLAIIHRLDKETSGVMVFGKTPLANKSLTQQFERREVKKKYELVTDRAVGRGEFTVETDIERAGERYVTRPIRSGGTRAETHFRVIRRNPMQTWLEASPFTGRTHQIRVHAVARGFPILGDMLYDGTPAPRLCLHAAELSFQHPANCKPVTFRVGANFDADTCLALREAFIPKGDTSAFRLIHGAADNFPGWHVDRLGDFLLSQSEQPLTAEQSQRLADWLARSGLRGAYHKPLLRRVRGAKPVETSPQLVLGDATPGKFFVRENGMQFELSFVEGYSVGLFLDQRDNRRRLLTSHVAAGFDFAPRTSPFAILNTFSYTCAFSVCAALAGACVTSLDLSKKYLDWGRRNFALNGLDPAAHDFIYGDCFDWLPRLAKKGRTFDAVLLDPPTFSHAKTSGAFTAEKDYVKLAALALPLLKPGGVLFASTNAATLAPENFLATIHGAISRAGRKISQEHYVPQPPDFPITRNEPAYLKTVWLRVT